MKEYIKSNDEIARINEELARAFKAAEIVVPYAPWRAALFMALYPRKYKRLRHLAKHAKKARVRKKNIKRLEKWPRKT